MMLSPFAALMLKLIDWLPSAWITGAEGVKNKPVVEADWLAAVFTLYHSWFWLKSTTGLPWAEW